MLNSPLPPDVDVTERLQTVISEWKGAQVGYKLERLYQDCVDLVGPADKQLLPLKIIPVRELDSTSLERALRHYRFSPDYAVDTVGRFESALVPVIRESNPSGFLFAYEENLRVQDQVALFAHAVGHLLINHQQRQAEREPVLNPEDGETHTDRLAELRYLDSSKNRNHMDRQVLDGFPKLTKLIEVPEESDVVQNLETRDLGPLLRKQGWVNQYVATPYRYTQGRVIPNSTQRGKRLTIDALLRVEASLPTAVVHVQRPTESQEEAVRRIRSAAQQLCVPFAYIFTHQKDFIELAWLHGDLSALQLRPTLPTRQELQTRWFSALQLTDQKALEALSYPYQPDMSPRYYQEAAINQAVIATLQALRGLRERRVLLTLATGTGKTQIAFQILWKLKKTYHPQVRNVLFLADRGYLLDQAQTNTFGPFRDAITRGMGEGDIAHDLLFGTYQWLTSPQDGDERYKIYPADYFDVIVIDECHRGSADDDSNWRKVLEHFSEAVQIGLTATPLDTVDVKTKQYFGPSVYTYTLSQGINDGYLAPYSVHRVQIGVVAQSTQAKNLQRKPQQTLDQQIVMQTGNTMRQYTQTIADHLAQYLRQQADPRAQKTIVFCVDNDHADEMRIALEKASVDWARSGDIVRIVNDDGSEGIRALNHFCTPRDRQPVIVTTSRLLSTGIDVPTCKNIVLARGVGSIVEFKQIIGRGTRLFAPEKTAFTILDYAGAIKHFFDPDFDGEPTSIQNESVPPAATTVPGSDEAGEPSTPPQQQTTTAPGEQPPEQNDPLEEFADEEYSHNGEEYIPTYEPNKVYEEDYKGTVQDPAEAEPVIDTTVEGVPSEGHTTTDAANNVTEQANEPVTASASQLIVPTTEVERPVTQNGSERPIESAIPRRRRKGGQTEEPSGATEETPLIIENRSGRRFEIIGEIIYELDASGARLRPGTISEFTEQALKDMIKTPADLRTYWSDKQMRTLLTEQLAKEVVALDALALALKLPEVDHFDLLQYVLFQQPTITRAERVQRLRVEHSAFFQRFEPNPLAKELLDVILDKYSRGHAPDVSNLQLLDIQPLKVRTRMEWSQAFSQEPTKANLNVVLKKLQQLLYSV